LCVASVDGVVQATGHWRRDPSAFAAHRAEVTKVMAHPDARGLGLGRLVTAAVIDHAADAGIETLHLGVRGNNHLAVAIYEDLGFVEWGRLPDVVEVGRLRFDDVRMVLKFPQPPGVVWWGSRPGGPGGSPRPEDHPPSPPQR
jgi:ribosomal protein S18 acetylase RimI-like enzyme